MQNINEVFSELDLRIDMLKRSYPATNTWNLEKRLQSITIIERNIFRFEQEAGQRIDITLRELQDLEGRGISILSKEAFYDEMWDNDHEITNSENEIIEETRKVAYERIKEELNFYISKLTELRNKKQTQSENTLTNPKSYMITIGADFNFPELKVQYPGVTPILSKDQLALLFYYLKESKIILPYEDKSLSKLVMSLTGYSKNTLRQDSFRQIHDLKTESNLEILKDALSAILKGIDKELKSNP